jgi:Na+/H+ antiporter NhaC
MKKLVRSASLAAFVLFPLYSSFAQQAQGIQRGVQAIQSTTTELKTYFEPVVVLIYVISGITAVVGIYRVYSKWQAGDQDVQKSAMGWVGSILILLAASAFIRTVFLD